jgi:RNA polymerase sigma factor (sigma-70 family)
MRTVEDITPVQEDRRLWERMRKGDEQALAVLFRGHYPSLYDYGIKLARQEELVKDGIQDVFAYIWEKRHGLAVVDSVRAYLLVALRRHLLKSLATQQQQKESFLQLDWQQDQEYFSPEDLLLMQEKDNAERRSLAKALRAIPPRVREALYLKTYDGLTYREIAAIMNVSPQVARNYVSEGFHRLREIFAPALQQFSIE